ncbi:sorting nexin-17 [Anthonomus grandis grandis]|uniref:sorting nexin-17 n=1 Tax=Anthonomus grandis grandis TaxID=2921223 RepID=UPI002165E844|nr:sorting nexin-17 [Anthonomus grandis grandis]
MHFSIPDTQELNEGSGSTFIGYNIHINGVFHCTVRYKQLHNLNEQMKREFGSENVPVFPPKKLLPLTSGQLEERRTLLEKYIQTVGQDSKIMSSNLVSGFFLSAQQETACKEKQDINFDVYTMNNGLIKIRLPNTDSSQKVLRKSLKHINLPAEYMPFFSLYLVKVDNAGNITTVLRKLLDFESPYLTQQAIRTETRIVIRKNYWSMQYDKELMTDPIALNLLYSQTVTEIERGWIIAMRESKSQLDKLKMGLAKKEYIEFAQKLKYYGFMQFGNCYCDYPKPRTKVLVSIGEEELSLRILGPGNLVKEGVFKVIRMKCWRVIATNVDYNNQIENSLYACNNSSHMMSSLELSFEYLMSKDKLQWITISSDQAILMSVCLQSMVDEILMRKNAYKKKNLQKSTEEWTYMKRDGSCQIISNRSIDLDNFEDQENNEADNYQEPFSVKSLQEKFSSVSFKNGRRHENHAFEGIGDDDL